MSPGVEDGEDADAGAEVFGIGGDGEQGFRDGLEQKAVEEFLVLKGDGGQLLGDSEDDVEVGNREQFGFAPLEPACAGQCLTLGAVPVAAGVIRDADVGALAALFDVAAEGGGAAGFNGAQEAELLKREPVALLEGGPVTSNDIGQLEGRPLHGDQGLGLRLAFL